MFGEHVWGNTTPNFQYTRYSGTESMVHASLTPTMLFVPQQSHDGLDRVQCRTEHSTSRRRGGPCEVRLGKICGLDESAPSRVNDKDQGSRFPDPCPPFLHFWRPKVEERGTRSHEPLFGDPWTHSGVNSHAARCSRGHGVADIATGTRNIELTRHTRILANFVLEIFLEWQKRMTTNLSSDSTQTPSLRKDSSQKGSPASAAGLD
jgi:hypothetical protein